MAHALSVASFTFRYPGAARPALSELSLDFPAGKCSVVLGPTGAGKSTLLQALAGVLGSHHRHAAAQGRIAVGPRSFEPFARSILFPEVALFLQDASVQISGLRETVEDEVRFALDNLGLPEAEARERVRAQLDEMGLAALSRRAPGQLSGGELQRVALAGVLVSRPSVLLLDEPLNSLDAPAQARLLRILASLRGRATIVLADYTVDAAIRIADHVVVLSEGSACFQGPPAHFVRRAAEFAKLLPAGDLERISTLVRTTARARRFAPHLAEGR